MSRRSLLLLAALTVLALAGLAGIATTAATGAGAQNRVRALTAAGQAHAELSVSQSLCSRPGSAADSAYGYAGDDPIDGGDLTGESGFWTVAADGVEVLGAGAADLTCGATADVPGVDEATCGAAVDLTGDAIKVLASSDSSAPAGSSENVGQAETEASAETASALSAEEQAGASETVPACVGYESVGTVEPGTLPGVEDGLSSATNSADALVNPSDVEGLTPHRLTI